MSDFRGMRLAAMRAKIAAIESGGRSDAAQGLCERDDAGAALGLALAAGQGGQLATGVLQDGKLAGVLAVEDLHAGHLVLDEVEQRVDRTT